MGFNPPKSQIPQGWVWMYYLSAPRYALSVLAAIVFADCPTPGGPELGCQILTETPLTFKKEMTVKHYVETIFNMVHDDIDFNIGIIFAFIALYRVLALLSLKYVNHQKR